MANTQILHRRIRSVRNVGQITKAMELVAASKLRRISQAVEHTRAYSDASRSIIGRLRHNQEARQHTFFSPPVNKKRLYVVFTGDRGLSGVFNSNVMATAVKSFDEDRRSGYEPMNVVLGRKGASYFSRMRDLPMLGEYENIADNPDMSVFAPIIATITSGFLQQDFGEVYIIFTAHNSTLSHEVQKLRLLPVGEDTDLDIESTNTKTANSEVVFELEPGAKSVIESSAKLYLESHLIRARVESAASEYAMQMLAMNNANRNAASEYAMQMLAMNNANRNAGDLIEDLTLELNATRQAAITQEIAEITGGAAAIEH